MKILHVTPYYAPAWEWGGVVAAVTSLARAQREAGHDVSVLTTDAARPGERGAAGTERVDGVTVTRVATRTPFLRAWLNLSWPRDFFGETRRVLEREAVNVVHCHELRSVETAAASRAANRAGVALVLSPHGTLPLETGRSTLKRAWDLLFARRVLGRFRRIVALTPAERDDVRAICARHGLPLTRDAVPIVPNGVDACPAVTPVERGAARERLGLGTDERVVLFLGRLHARKRIPLLLEAFAVFARRGPPARLVLAGPDGGALAGIRAAAGRLGLTPHVLLPGFVDADARRALFAAADVFTLVGFGEGLPMAGLEALAAGVPVVLGAGCPLAEAAAAGAGFVVDATPDAFAEGWERVIAAADPAMGRRGRDLASASFSWPAVVTRLDAVYRSALAPDVHA